jgi:hypothetical protein
MHCQGNVAPPLITALVTAMTDNALPAVLASTLTAQLLPTHRFHLARASLLQTVTMESKQW